MAKKADKPRSMAADIIGVVREGTKRWTKTVKAEERSPASRSYRYARMTRERGVSFKEAAAQIMEQAYLQASGNGQYPANARQIMYAARPHIQKVTEQKLNDNYFTQTLLPDYLNETGVAWDVVYDARGHFNEPHAGESFGVGTLQVRNYLAGFCDPRVVDACLSKAEVQTNGPQGNFGGGPVHRERGFRSTAESGADRRQIRSRYHVDQRDVGDCSESARRRDVPRPRHSAAAAARLRQGWVLDRRHAAARHPPLRVPEQHHDHRPRPELSQTSRRWDSRASTNSIRRAIRPR